jgi:copper(I)-binding protein
LLLAVGGLGLGRARAAEGFGSARVGGLHVSGAYIRVARQPSVDDAGDGYLTIVNRSGHPAQLDAATSPASASVVLHHGALASGGPSNGAPEHLYCGLAPATPTGQLVALRTDTDPLLVPAGATITIAPGHGRFALTRLLATARRGDRVPLSLYLDSGARIDVLVPIR